LMALLEMADALRRSPLLTARNGWRDARTIRPGTTTFPHPCTGEVVIHQAVANLSHRPIPLPINQATQEL
jgi:hypothetical protein